MREPSSSSLAAEAQRRAGGQAARETKQRCRRRAATLAEVTRARASDAQGATSEVGVRYGGVFRRAPMRHYTGALDPVRASLRGDRKPRRGDR